MGNGRCMIRLGHKKCTSATGDTALCVCHGLSIALV